MMGRLVRDVRRPLQGGYAPAEPIDPMQTRRNPRGILPPRLPEPSRTSNQKEVLSAVQTNELHPALTAFLGLDFVRTENERADLESKEVKQYSLKQPKKVFDYLMTDAGYAKDTLRLPRESGNSKVFMVSGFLTTTGTLWTLSSTSQHTTGFTVTVPVSVAAGVLVPGLTDPSVSPQYKTEGSISRSMFTAEEIFAISYHTIKIERRIDLEARKINRQPVFGQPRRVKRRHLGLGAESDEEEMADFDSDEDQERDGRVCRCHTAVAAIRLQ
jgi:hypothetical protein